MRKKFAVIMVLVVILLPSNLIWAQDWGVGFKVLPVHIFVMMDVGENFSLEGGFREMGGIRPILGVGRPLGIYLNLRGHLFEDFELAPFPWPLQGFGAGGLIGAPVEGEFLFGFQGSLGVESNIPEVPFTLLVEIGYGITIFRGILHGVPSITIGMRLDF